MSEGAPPAKRVKADETGTAAPYQPSAKAQRTRNPIRRIVDNINRTPPECDKDVIPLSLGDPTVYGNLLAPDVLVEAVVSSARSFKCNGYAHSAGTPAARAAVADYFSVPGAAVTGEDVILASGGSGALEMAITAVVDEGQNLLVPAPGFPLYQVIAESNGSSVKYYPLDPAHDWEVDVAQLETLVDDNTRAILVNNPSNPCGSVLSDANLRAVLAVAERHQLIIIADEIYGPMTFTGHRFTPIAALSTTVPVLAVGGMAKMFLVPGWRVGWVMIHERRGELAALRQGLLNLSQLILGANTLVQSALPKVLVKRVAGAATEADAMDTSSSGSNGQAPAHDEECLRLESFRASYVGALEAAAVFSSKELRKAPGLTIIEPRGAMYMMVQVNAHQFRDLDNDQTFAERLYKEEAVFVLPGACFNAPGFFRIVFTAPKEKLQEAYARITAFCHRHYCPTTAAAAAAAEDDGIVRLA